MPRLVSVPGLGILALLGIGCAAATEHGKVTSDLESGVFHDSGTGINDSSPSEECNGVDDDGDGRTDEGFSDADADGNADCIDLDCRAAGPTAHAAELDETCSAEVVNPWSVFVETEIGVTASDGTGTYALGAPLVAQLSDDDGNGIIDAQDDADVVIAPFDRSDAVLLALSAQTWTEEWAITTPHALVMGMAIADLFADQAPEVVAAMDIGEGPIWYVVAMDGQNGTTTWSVSLPIETEERLSGELVAVTFADIDADGFPEVVTPVTVHDGRTGETLFEMPIESSLDDSCCYNLVRPPTVADVDLDGYPEIIVGGTVYAADGTVRWTTAAATNFEQFSAVVQADTDPEGEIVMIGDAFRVYDTDGTLLVEAAESFRECGTPAIADFDGDGEPDVAFSDGGTTYLYGLDGTQKWTFSNGDTSGGMAGCTGWDIDGDGAAEVLFGSQYDFFVLDGRTGAIRIDYQNHYSITFGEAPVVADIDNDGSGEILFVDCGPPLADGSYPTDKMLTVLGHVGGTGWPDPEGLWPGSDYAIDNLGDAGEVAPPSDWWTTRGMYRSKPAGILPNGANLRVAITDVCVASCDASNGFGRVELQLSNVGPDDAPGGLAVSLYRDDGVFLSSVSTTESIASGTASAGIEFTVNAAAVGAHGLVAVVDDDGTGSGSLGECDEADNSGLWSTPLCPDN